MGGRLIEEAKSWQQVDSTHILLLTKIAKEEDQESPVRRVGLIWWWWLEEGIIDAFACTCMQLPPLFHPVGSLAVVLLIVLLMSFSWSFQATTSAIHWPPYFGPLVISSFSLVQFFPFFVLPSASVLSSVVKVTIHSSLSSDLKRIMKFD